MLKERPTFGFTRGEYLKERPTFGLTRGEYLEERLTFGSLTRGELSREASYIWIIDARRAFSKSVLHMDYVYFFFTVSRPYMTRGELAR